MYVLIRTNEFEEYYDIIAVSADRDKLADYVTDKGWKHDLLADEYRLSDEWGEITHRIVKAELIA